VPLAPTTIQRIRDWVIEEPGYTVAYAAWCLGISPELMRQANAELLRLEIVRQIEPKIGHEGAVYAYNPEITNGRPPQRKPLPELDASIGVGSEAAQRNVVVPHTRHEGASDRPGRNRKRQAKGVRVRRGGGFRP
jgi:hypothetical protein